MPPSQLCSLQPTQQRTAARGEHCRPHRPPPAAWARLQPAAGATRRRLLPPQAADSTQQEAGSSSSSSNAAPGGSLAATWSPTPSASTSAHALPTCHLHCRPCGGQAGPVERGGRDPAGQRGARDAAGGHRGGAGKAGMAWCWRHCLPVLSSCFAFFSARFPGCLLPLWHSPRPHLLACLPASCASPVRQVAVEGYGSGAELDFGLLEGKWRLEYTTARDVLPLVAPQRLPAPLQVRYACVRRCRCSINAGQRSTLRQSVWQRVLGTMPLPARHLDRAATHAFPVQSLTHSSSHALSPPPPLPHTCTRRSAASGSSSPRWRRGGCRTSSRRTCRRCRCWAPRGWACRWWWRRGMRPAPRAA